MLVKKKIFCGNCPSSCSNENVKEGESEVRKAININYRRKLIENKIPGEERSSSKDDQECFRHLCSEALSESKS
ncbi:hypothetical protein HHI36_010032, partial [Cryptolaemus montrouzieri]